MNVPKILDESGWKDFLRKNKLKDIGLSRPLAQLKRVDEEQHDEALGLLGEIAKLLQQGKRGKEIAAAPEAAERFDDMLDAVDDERRAVEKAHAAHEKEQKAQAAAAKKKETEDEEEEEATPELLTTKMKPLLRQVAQGATMFALVAKSGKQAVVMLSRKPIPPARRRMLGQELGGGSTKYYPGTCRLEAGFTTFTLSSEVAGLTKLVKAALLQQTGLRVNKVKCRGDDGDDQDDS